MDFIAPKHFAVFNLADSAIVCGGILIVMLSFTRAGPGRHRPQGLSRRPTARSSTGSVRGWSARSGILDG